MILAAGLVAVTLAAFWPINGHDFVNLDDDLYVTDNPQVKAGFTWEGMGWAFTALHAGNWHPLTWLSHMLDVELFGLDAGGPHLVSLLLHAASAVLLFETLRKTTGALWPSALAAALFAVHPLRVESVAWVAERKDVLSGFLWMATLLAYAGYARRPSRGRYVAVAGLFALGLLAKPMVVTLPLVLLLLDFWPLGRLRSADAGLTAQRAGSPAIPWPRVVREKVPLLLLAAASAAVTIAAQQTAGAVQSLHEIPLAVRCSTALVAYAAYLGKALWPAGLAVFYPHPETHPPLWQVLVAATVLGGVSAAAVRFRSRHPYLLVGWVWYLVTLLPVSGLVQVGHQWMADRYTYLPLVGVFVVVSWAAAEAVRRWCPRAAWTAGLGAAGVLLGLGVASRLQVGHWRDSASLFRHALEVTSGNWLAHNNLGVALAREGRPEEAEIQFRAAVAVLPQYAVAWKNLGDTLAGQGGFEEAVASYAEAVRLFPAYPRAYCNMGKALVEAGRPKEGLARFQEALRWGAGAAGVHAEAGFALRRAGLLAEAVAEYEKAVAAEPTYAEAHNGLGVTLSLLGETDRAVGHFAEAARLRPQYLEALYNWGIALAGAGHLEEAVERYRQALRVHPGDAELRNNLGVALAGLGRLEEAATEFAEALRIRPNFNEARQNLDRIAFGGAR